MTSGKYLSPSDRYPSFDLGSIRPHEDPPDERNYLSAPDLPTLDNLRAVDRSINVSDLG